MAIRGQIFPWLPKEIISNVVSLSRSIYSTANRDALVTTKPDGLAASRRASHCSSYIALNLPSSLQIPRAVPSRHVWFAGGSDLHSPLERLPAFALHCPYIILTQVLRFLSRELKRDSTLIICSVISKIYKYSVICAIARQERKHAYKNVRNLLRKFTPEIASNAYATSTMRRQIYYRRNKRRPSIVSGNGINDVSLRDACGGL